MSEEGTTSQTDEDAVVVDDDDDDSGSTGTATAKTLAPVTDEDHVRGDIEKAKVVVVEYSDYECPFCGRHHPTMLDIMDKYGDDVAWVYRHFPLSFHPEAKPAALAAECAGEQDKFWEYTDELFANQDSLSDDYYGELADELGLNRSQFDDCVESEKYASKISEDTSSGRAAGVSGTPATFVNGQLVSGAVPLETFVDLIDAELE
ncbi:DsbA family protein [Candidatus Uhrbacteria bacterium]|nr:DsbA family protein [Candidatus Uhrbacteria bacterium]